MDETEPRPWCYLCYLPSLNLHSQPTKEPGQVIVASLQQNLLRHVAELGHLSGLTGQQIWRVHGITRWWEVRAVGLKYQAFKGKPTSQSREIWGRCRLPCHPHQQVPEAFPSTITSGCSPPVTLSWHTLYCWGTGIPPWSSSRTYKTGFPPFSAFMSSIASTSTAWANSWFRRNFTWTSTKFRTATCTVLSPCVIPGIMNSFFCAKLSTGSNAKGTFAGLSILASTYTTELGGRDSFFLTTSRLIWKALVLTSLRMCACRMSPLPNSNVSFPRSTLHLLPRRKSMPKINESWMSASMTSQ